jgi:glycosyltransferase involved in cell wall biosynthesis
MLVANPITYDGRVLRHAKTLAQAGYDVEVIGVVGPKDRAEPPPGRDFAWRRLDRRRRGIAPRLRWFSSALRQHTALSLCTRLPESLLAHLPKLTALSESLAVATSAPELLLETLRRPPEIIHANDLNTLPAAAWAARILRCPYVYDAHELYADEHPDLSSAERRVRAAVEGRYAKAAAAVLTVNRLLADDLVARYGILPPIVLRNLPERVSGPNPVTSERPLGEPGTLRLLYHGAHIGLAQHGVDDILRALSRVSGRAAVTLTMRGNLQAAEASALRRRLFELRISDCVRICPPVPGAEALVRAAIADGAEVGLAVHPPLCGNYNLTTSSKLYEYQAAGLACCASDLAGNRLTIAPGAGIFYAPGNDEELAAHFVELALDRPRLRAMQQAAYRHAQAELGWERERAQLLTLYDALGRRERG